MKTKLLKLITDPFFSLLIFGIVINIRAIIKYSWIEMWQIYCPYLIFGVIILIVAFFVWLFGKWFSWHKNKFQDK